MSKRRSKTSSALGWLASLLFWGCLLVAVGLYSVVVLSPKVIAFLELDQEYRGNQARLVRMEGQVEYFDKVAGALEKDPAFAAELARIEFDASKPGEERIAVDNRLSLQAPQPANPVVDTVDPIAWYVPTLKTFVENEDHRNLLLAGAATLVIFAFTFLQDSPVLVKARHPGR